MRNCCHLDLSESEIPNKNRVFSSFFIAFSFLFHQSLTVTDDFPSYWVLGIDQSGRINESIDNGVCSKSVIIPTSFMVHLHVDSERDRERVFEKWFKWTIGSV